MKVRIGSLCSGYEGLGMAVQTVLGGELTWVADPDPGASAILAHHWPDVPNFGDITAVDWEEVAEVDVLCAGFPCQDVSSAGLRAGMLAGNRSGLWWHVARAIAVLRPPLVVIENVGGLLSARADSDVEPCPWCLGDPSDQPHLRALGAVLGDLAALGFDAVWTSLRVSDVGGCHPRRRVFILAWPAADTAGQRPVRSGLARGRRPGLANGRVAATYPECDGRQGQREDPGTRSGRPSTAFIGCGSAGGGVAPADPQSDGRYEGRPESAGIVGGSDAALGGDAAPADGNRPADLDWDAYGPAIRRWARVLGRPAPDPTEPAPRGGRRLSPVFVEWMMGLPEGHVTAVPGLSRNQQLTALGNGVVPQQGAAAIAELLDRMRTEVAA